MATAIRAIPTLYGETAKSFESEAKRTEQNPGTTARRQRASFRFRTQGSRFMVLTVGTHLMVASCRVNLCNAEYM